MTKEENDSWYHYEFYMSLDPKILPVLTSIPQERVDVKIGLLIAVFLCYNGLPKCIGKFLGVLLISED